jgi:hypothetical protein
MMNGTIPNCPLCGTAALATFGTAGRRVYEVACPACGEYEITDQGLAAVTSNPDVKGLRWCLSAATRREWEREQRVLLKSSNWPEYVDLFIGTSVSMKARSLLEVIHRNSEFFGNVVDFSHKTDWPLIAAKGPEECWSILGYLQDDRLLHAPGQSKEQWMLTWKGWEAVEPVAGGVPGIGFVAMAFDPDLDVIFEEGIRSAIETDCGLHAVRIDRKHFAEKICDRMLVEIKRSQFLVADFTFQRAGVYFEAGYALALGRPVIWLCREDQVSDLHFDTRQYPHILWREAADLRVQLRDRVRALIPGARTT